MSEHTGIWIPKHIQLDKELTPLQKILWAIINAMPNGLIMSDQAIANNLACSIHNARKQLVFLEEKGYITKSGKYGDRRYQIVGSNILPKVSNQLPQSSNRLQTSTGESSNAWETDWYSVVTQSSNTLPQKEYINKKKEKGEEKSLRGGFSPKIDEDVLY